MNKLYWRPQRISIRLLWIVAFVAILGLFTVESYTVIEKQPHYSDKMKAARLALKAFETIRQEKQKRGIPIDEEADPLKTGLIGELLSPTTTNPGHLPSKQTSTNPNFAAVLVHMLKRAKVNEGDKVAVGFSGSFPAINICVLSALYTLKVDPIIIASAGSSQWGANNPGFMWPDMEKVLLEKKIFPFRSIAISRGGIDDRALGLTKKSRQMLDDVIERSGVEMLRVSNYSESVDRRMELYSEYAGDSEITAYINVGGGTTSVGTKVGKKMFRPGLNRSIPRGVMDIDSVMTRFGIEGIPVIHMSKINDIAERFGLPLQPMTPPKVGEGKIFYKEVHSSYLAAGLLIVIFALMVVFVRFDWGYLFLSSNKKDSTPSRPERMV